LSSEPKIPGLGADDDNILHKCRTWS